MTDIFLLIGDNETRSRMTRLLRTKREEYRVLGSTSMGNIGLEKITRLNPDIVIMSLSLGFVHGTQVLLELQRSHYAGRMLILQETDAEVVPPEFTGCSILLKSSDLTDHTLFETLEQIMKMNIDLAGIITNNIYEEFLQCKNLTDYSALLSDKYRIHFDFRRAFRLIICSILKSGYTAGMFISENIERLKGILRQNGESCIFTVENDICMLINDFYDTGEGLINNLYQFIKFKIQDFRFYVSEPARTIDDLDTLLRNEKAGRELCFFCAEKAIVYEGRHRRKRNLDEREKDTLVSEIVRDIYENDLNQLHEDLRKLFAMLKTGQRMQDMYQILEVMEFYAEEVFAADKRYVYQELIRRNLFSVEDLEIYMLKHIEQFIIARCPKLSSNNSIRSAIQYIRQNSDKDLSLAAVAERELLSVTYFSSLFKQCVNLNFKEYLTRIRLRKAKNLLEKNKYRVYEVARMSGFRDEKYFSKVFQRHVGMTPRDFMKHSVENNILSK